MPAMTEKKVIDKLTSHIYHGQVLCAVCPYTFLCVSFCFEFTFGMVVKHSVRLLARSHHETTKYIYSNLDHNVFPKLVGKYVIRKAIRGTRSVAKCYVNL